METTKCRAKFKCNSVTDHGGGKKSVQMDPVYSTDPNSENKKFWDATPSGQLQMTWINDRANFVAGREYYLDLIEA